MLNTGAWDRAPVEASTLNISQCVGKSGLKWDLPRLDLADSLGLVNASLGEMLVDHTRQDMFWVLELEQRCHVEVSRHKVGMCKLACSVDTLVYQQCSFHLRYYLKTYLFTVYQSHESLDHSRNHILKVVLLVMPPMPLLFPCVFLESRGNRCRLD